MKVYVLHFGSRGSLTQAFDRILANPDVESCMIESDRNRIRFMANESAAEKITEEIYLDRGLLWCSRHEVERGA
ncbi:MAG: hypothetical protein ACQGVC_26650 [Myxococcota bacterium]